MSSSTFTRTALTLSLLRVYRCYRIYWHAMRLYLLAYIYWHCAAEHFSDALQLYSSTYIGIHCASASCSWLYCSSKTEYWLVLLQQHNRILLLLVMRQIVLLLPQNVVTATNIATRRMLTCADGCWRVLLISDAPHNVVIANNIAASKYLQLFELHLSHGKRHGDKHKRAPYRQLCTGCYSFRALCRFANPPLSY